MSQCEMCGKAAGTRRHLVEGNVMELGTCCARFGTPMDAPAATGSPAAMAQGLERRATRMTSKNIYQEPDLDFVEDFGRRIQVGRTNLGITKEDLGTKVHARVPELNKFEAGQLRPTHQQARALERELKITLLEAVAAAPASATAKKGPKGTGLTIGDILKDALGKE